MKIPFLCLCNASGFFSSTCRFLLIFLAILIMPCQAYGEERIRVGGGASSYSSESGGILSGKDPQTGDDVIRVRPNTRIDPYPPYQPPIYPEIYPQFGNSGSTGRPDKDRENNYDKDRHTDRDNRHAPDFRRDRGQSWGAGHGTTHGSRPGYGNEHGWNSGPGYRPGWGGGNGNNHGWNPGHHNNQGWGTGWGNSGPNWWNGQGSNSKPFVYNPNRPGGSVPQFPGHKPGPRPRPR